jgi:glucose-1-phosphate adenylyltransferase
VAGIRSVINSGAELRDVVLMGADYYEGDPRETPLSLPRNAPSIGIGRNCVIKRAIIDKNARIGDGVVITPEGKPDNFDSEHFYIRDGVVVIPKNAVLPSGSWV